MTKPIIWSPLSENDFENILDYLDKKWGNQVAFNFIELTENLLNQIAINPKQFPVFYKGKRSESVCLPNTIRYSTRMEKPKLKF